MEIIIKLKLGRPSLKAAVLDFDGTISTLRHGWEDIMKLMMLEMISGGTDIDESLEEEVSRYINASTGVQTIHQMKWLTEAVHRHGRNPGASSNPWWYKEEYNWRLMEPVQKRKDLILSGRKKPEDFLIRGSVKLLEALTEKGIEIYAASGTDDPDVKEEADVLGVKSYFKKISGAPLGRTNCSKQAVLKMLIAQDGLAGPEVVVIGDGKVEVSLGREVDAITLGVASDEEKRYGINDAKRKRLIKAGTHAITGDFGNTEEIIEWLGL